MKYYNIVDKKVEITQEGKDVLKRMGMSIGQLCKMNDGELEVFVNKTIESCRMPYASDSDKNIVKEKHASVDGLDRSRANTYNWSKYDGQRVDGFVQRGRFPANLLVSDDALDTGRATKSVPHTHDHKKDTLVYGGGKGLGIRKGDSYYDDSGSFSRYFDLDRWWIENLPESVKKTFPFLIVPKASKSEKNAGLGNLSESDCERTNQNFKCKKCHKFMVVSKERPNSKCVCVSPEWERPKHANTHPTVKPVKLFSYLIMLGSREGDIVLDPFLGSGTTLVAADMLHRIGLGFELNREYEPIIEGRIKRDDMKLEDFL